LKGLIGSRPPHIIINQARWFAVYSNDFIAIPPKQIGISGKTGQENFLKALSLYLLSDFVRYYELFFSPEMGIQESISSLHTLKSIPVPLHNEVNINIWAQLYDELVTTEYFSTQQMNIFQREAEDTMQVRRDALEKKANALVSQALGLSKEDRLLIHDLLYERRKLIRGKISPDLMQPPSEKEMHAYIEVLRDQLNSFLDNEDNELHIINVLYHNTTGMLEITIDEVSTADTLQIRRANKALAQEFTKLRSRLLKQHSQWLYFERNLTIFDNERTYLFKPMERLHWLPSQALTDASDLIAKTMCAEVH
jgi:hypothetical protein